MKAETVERHEVVVIGAGQAGLAAGYHLARRGIEFVILEASPRQRRAADAGQRNRARRSECHLVHRVRPDYGWIDLPVLGEDGWPREFRGAVDSSPGLYFLGIPFLYSFTSMLVLGAGRDAAYVVERVARRRGSEIP